MIKSVTYIEPNGDIPLKERVRRANKLSCQIGHPIQETIIISIHVNAAGKGKKWHNATKRCLGFLYFGVSFSDNCQSNYFGKFILLRILI